MKSIKRLLAFLVFCHGISYAFGQKTYINESFNSETVPSYFESTCDTTKFDVYDGQLVTKSNVVNDVFSISTYIGHRHSAEWSIDVHLPFATSSSNYIEYYLWADSSCLEEATEAICIRIGDTKDQLVLYQKDNDELSLVGASPFGVTHSLSGSMLCTLGADSVLRLSFYDSTKAMVLWEYELDSFSLKRNGYMGILVKQSTSSFHQKHRFDNVYYGIIRRDSIAPQVETLTVLHDSILQLVFTEPVDVNSMNAERFNLLPTQIKPTQIEVQDDTVELMFDEVFITQSYELALDSVSDLFGNYLTQLTLPFDYVKLEAANLHDVLLTEILADPSPSVQLPQHEFIELTNRTDKIIDLNGWIISDRKSESVLDEFYLWPESSVVLVDRSYQNHFAEFKNVMPVSGLISLNNAGDSLLLLDNSRKVIHEVNYLRDWHTEEWKMEGGWSLEMIDVDLPCTESKNWASSTSKTGGSPGTLNSVKAKLFDFEAPRVVNVEVADKYLVLTFDESLLYYDPNEKDFTLEGNDIVSIRKVNPYQLRIELSQELIPGRNYVLQVDGVMDCSGNKVENGTYNVAIGGELVRHCVIINELLYDVSESCAEFIEVYNPTDITYNLNDLFIGYKDSIGRWKNLYEITGHTVLIQPHQYVALSTDTAALKRCKPSAKNTIQALKLPSFVNDGGTLGLSDYMGNVIDSFSYSDDLHFSLLSNTKDVSLERLGHKVENPTWLSAAQTYNYATPGFANSHLAGLTTEKGFCSIATDPVSPNDDGFNDVLVVHYSPVQSSTLVHVRIFDHVGRLVAFPVNTGYVGTDNQFIWDCLGSNGALVASGIYILHLESISVTGQKQVFKKGFTVVR